MTNDNMAPDVIEVEDLEVLEVAPEDDIDMPDDAFSDEEEALLSKYQVDLSDFQEINDFMEAKESGELRKELEAMAEEYTNTEELEDEGDDDQDGNQGALVAIDRSTQDLRQKIKMRDEEKKSFSVAEPQEVKEEAHPSDGIGNLWGASGSKREVDISKISESDLISDKEAEEVKALATDGAQFDEVNGVMVNTAESTDHNEKLVATESERRRDGAYGRIRLNDDSLRFSKNNGLSKGEEMDVDDLIEGIEKAQEDRKAKKIKEAVDSEIERQMDQDEGRAM